MKFDNWVFSRLSEPFSADEVHWRAGGGNTILAYIDARQVIERLNYVVGAENWSDYYDPIVFENTDVRETTDFEALKEKYVKQGVNLTDVFWMRNGVINNVKNKADATFSYNNVKYGGVRCTLNVLGSIHQDVGTVSMADQFKGAHSDALKRAAVKFGIGMYLYDLKNLRGGRVDRGIVVEPPTLPDWALPAERGNPDDAIMQMFEKARQNKNINSIEIENIYNSISVMGNYNSAAPLIVKRDVYEQLKTLIDSAGEE